jgi:hypothetical protein
MSSRTGARHYVNGGIALAKKPLIRPDCILRQPDLRNHSAPVYISVTVYSVLEKVASQIPENPLLLIVIDKKTFIIGIILL